jgi:LysR family glycine cleavage system transcriptional activator
LREPDDLRWHTLLHVDGTPDEEYWPDWPMWLHSAGATLVDGARGIRLSQTNMALQLAEDGQGIALGSRVLAGDALVAGRLVRPFVAGFPVSFAYYMVVPEPIADRPRVAAFREWVLSEARKDQPE